MALKVGIWGTGFLGTELFWRLLGRSDIEIVYTVDSRRGNGDINAVQVAFLALGPEQSMRLAFVLLSDGKKIIDLSGAHRLRKEAFYPPFYNFTHLYPELLKEAVYGLPEINRGAIRQARLVASAGCYATGIILGLRPLAENRMISSSGLISVKAISGYTGAGKGAKIPGDIRAYKGGRQHQHVPEIEQALGLVDQLEFYPHIAPWPRGIEIIIRVRLVSSVDMVDFYQSFYEQELFVRIKSKDVEIESVARTNFCDIYPAAEDGIATIKVVLDNLGKGGAGQAVQNFNIMCGFPEELVH